MLKSTIENVREISPLIHNITNYVTVNDVANIILACGASPIMADDSEEVEDITSVCTALNINIGTLNRNTIPSMILAGKKANELNYPTVLDPVGVGASNLRNKTAKELLENVKFSVIRGNVSEIKFLATGIGAGKGVDAAVGDAVTEENLDSMVKFAKSFAKETGSIIAITGAIDLVADAERCFVIRNGRAEMGKITGTGCQLSGLIASFIAANQDNMLEATAAAVIDMGLSGEIGWSNMEKTDGNSTYRNRIIDAIYNMDGNKLEEGAKFEIK